MTSITQTWTYNHKLLIITLALTVIVLIQAGFYPTLPVLEAETIQYVQTDYSLDKQVELRAHELREANVQFDLEQYRQQAIREINVQLQAMATTSPFVDYQALAEEYGY